MRDYKRRETGLASTQQAHSLVVAVPLAVAVAVAVATLMMTKMAVSKSDIQEGLEGASTAR
jgi:hypothetical protein